MSIKKDDRASQKHPVEPPPETPSSNEGVFKRPNFAKTVTSLIGNNVKVKTKAGSTYEGVFSTLSSDFEVVVALSHEIDPGDPFFGRVDNDSIVFKPEDILSISCVNVNLQEALDMSQRLDFAGDFSTKTEDIWGDRRQDSEPYDKGWNDLLRNHKEAEYCSTGFSEDMSSYSSIYSHSDFGKAGADSAKDDSFNDMRQKYDQRGDHPKPQRKPNMPDGGIPEDIPPAEVTNEKTSNLNPYAKPFTPMETPPEKECQGIPSLAAVVLPTYVVPAANSPSKLDAGHQGGGGAPSLLGGGPLANQYMQYPYGDSYDEKLYSSYDSLPISAHDYQQYYPHLQYIQYFRRFY